MSDFLKELIEQFSFESKEILQKLENFFISFHETLVDEIYRELHTLKGNAGVIYSNLSDDFKLKKNFEIFKEIVHKFEAIVKSLKNGEIEYSSELNDLSLEVIDVLNEILELSEDEKLIEKNYEDLIAKIENFSSKPKISTSEPKEKPSKEDYVELTGEEFFGEIEKYEPPPKPEKKEKKETQVIHFDKFLKKEDFKIIQVKTDKIDYLLSFVSELINVKNIFDFIVEKESNKVSIELKNALQRLKFITSNIQKSVLKLRLVPVRDILQKFPRIVSEYQKIFNKKINLTIKGEDIEIDKSILTHLNDILVHIVRNAIDHGIESPQERIASGKNEIGNIIIQASIEKEFFRITVADDGRGINPDIIREKAIQKGIITKEQANNLSEHNLIQLIFYPGFSTRDDVSEISGRGVGLDVVKDIVKKLNGKIDVFSKVGKGTVFRIHLPISLNIIKVLVVTLENLYFSIPYSDILFTLSVEKDKIKNHADSLILIYDGSKIQIFDLGVLLGYRDKILERDNYDIVVIEVDKEKIGFIVDKLNDENEIVVNPLPDFISAIPGISGATILGNGKISVVLNLKDLMV